MEQPEEQFEETQPSGGEDVSSILSEGLKGQEDSPNDVTQAEEQPSQEQPEAPQTQEKAELYAKLVLDQEKSVPFRTQEELEDFIEANKDTFEKTGHYLRQSDYTRKTQELSKEREEFEAQKQEEEASWGEVKPDENSMEAFKSLWKVFQYGGPELQNQLNAFMHDVTLISKGQPPQGPLSGEVGQSNVNPEVIALKQELAQLKQQYQSTEQKVSSETQQRMAEQAKRDWDSWSSQMKDQGITIDQRMEESMVPYIRSTDPSWEPSKRLNVAYKLACEELGISAPIETKKVIKDAKQKISQTPRRPMTKASASTQPEAKNIEDILRNGMNEIQSA